jgi:hypothetical protein
MSPIRPIRSAAFSLAAILATSLWAADAPDSAKPKPDFPPHTEVLKDYRQVISTIDKTNTLFSVWIRDKDQQVLAAFPQNFAQKKFFIALSIACGERFAGLQAGDMYV